MDYLEVINIVQNEYLKANNRAKFEITEVKRKCLLSTDKEAFINNELMGIDYKKSAFGYYYIACNYFCGSTWLEMRDVITQYYINHTDLFTDQSCIESDVYTFLFAFCLERELQQLKAAPEPPEKAPGQPQGKRGQGGRRVKPFESHLIGTQEEQRHTRERLHKLIDGRQGKEVVLYIKAAVQCGKITKPNYTTIKKEFGDIGSQQNFDAYMSKSVFTEDELTGAKNSLIQKK